MEILVHLLYQFPFLFFVYDVYVHGACDAVGLAFQRGRAHLYTQLGDLQMSCATH